jgi:hypothetical protein
MSEQNNHPRDRASPASGAAGSGVSRRALIRAGMAAVPVVAAMKTEMVLATTTNTTVRPSSFASFQANNCSVAPGRNTTGNYISLSDCQSRCNTQTALGSMRYFKSTLYTNWGFTFHTGCGLSSSVNVKTLLSTLVSTSTPDLTRLAVYCAAAHIAAQSYAGSSFLTATQCKDIWHNKGIWSPMAGVNWSLAQTLAYFDRVYGIGTNKFDACLTSGSGGTTSGGC